MHDSHFHVTNWKRHLSTVIYISADTDTFPAQYSYQIDIYFEFDNDLVTQQGSLTDVINYINVLISAANIVYEKETDIHLGKMVLS